MLRLREQVVERLIDERLVAQGAAREGITVSDAELVDQIMRIGAFQEGGRFSRDRYVRLLAMTQPPMTPWRLRGRVPGGAGAAAPAGADRGRARRSPRPRRDRPGKRTGAACARATSWSPAAAGEALAATDAELDTYYKAHPARVHPARAPAGPRGDPAGGERAGAGRHRRRHRGGVQGPPEPVRAAGADEGLAHPDQGARGRRQRGRGPGQGPGRERRSRGSAAAPTSPRWRGRRRRIPSTASRGRRPRPDRRGASSCPRSTRPSRASSRASWAGPSGAPSATTSSRCSRSCPARGRS